MSRENLKVDHKTVIEEFKRKHNYLVENMPVKVEVSNIKNLSSDVIDELKCGDIISKKTGNQYHNYIVTFKSKTGICLTYMDASVIETQSYDKVGNNWVYNSEDKTPNLLEIPTTLEQIKDNAGHNRFVEGNYTPPTITGFTFTYNKWSLSGTHLMIVLAGNVEANTTLADNQKLCEIDLPEWMIEKLVPFTGNSIIIEQMIEYTNAWTIVNIGAITLKKLSTTKISIDNVSGNHTITSAGTFRIKFDLLIDNEVSVSAGE